MTVKPRWKKDESNIKNEYMNAGGKNEGGEQIIN